MPGLIPDIMSGAGSGGGGGQSNPMSMLSMLMGGPGSLLRSMPLIGQDPLIKMLSGPGGPLFSPFGGGSGDAANPIGSLGK